MRVQLKPDARLPRKAQYPLHPDAEVGIKNSIEGLVKAGVLIETTSYCNTPILPVIKANKNRWRLVHDFRAITEIVEDLQAEVPNPHTLLTNVPPDAKYFTVIDLCSAYFSVPLAEESRYLFAFTYAGKQYTYTRIPQGFKHSLHIFNRILKADLEAKNATGSLLAVLAPVVLIEPQLKLDDIIRI